VVSSSSGATVFATRGSVTLSVNGFSSSFARTRAAAQSLTLYAGERASLNRSGLVSAIVLGTQAGSGGAGDPTSITGASALRMSVKVPNLSAESERLGMSLEDAAAEGIGASLVKRQSGGVIGLRLGDLLLNALPVGDVTVNPLADNGLVIETDGTATVTHEGVVMRFVPSVGDLAQFTNDLQALLPGAQVKVKDDGVITAAFGETTYVVRPDWATTSAAEAGIHSDAEGRLRYGLNEQVIALNPAFADWGKLKAAIAVALPGSQAKVNLDGTVSITLNDTAFTLVPAYQLEAAPVGQTGAWWSTEDGRMFIRNADGSVQEFSIQ
jgi:phage tail protein X